MSELSQREELEVSKSFPLALTSGSRRRSQTLPARAIGRSHGTRNTAVSLLVIQLENRELALPPDRRLAEAPHGISTPSHRASTSARPRLRSRRRSPPWTC